MYKIEKKTSGYLLIFKGSIDAREMQQWLEELREILEAAPRSFGTIVDMRELEPLQSDAQAIMVKGQELAKKKGKKRTAVIVNNPVTEMQFRRLTKTSGIYESERFLDASANPDWWKFAVDWVKQGIDPYKR